MKIARHSAEWESGEGVWEGGGGLGSGVDTVCMWVPEHKFNGRILATLANCVRVTKSLWEKIVYKGSFGTLHSMVILVQKCVLPKVGQPTIQTNLAKKIYFKPCLCYTRLSALTIFTQLFTLYSLHLPVMVIYAQVDVNSSSPLGQCQWPRCEIFYLCFWASSTSSGIPSMDRYHTPLPSIWLWHIIISVKIFWINIYSLLKSVILPHRTQC